MVGKSMMDFVSVVVQRVFGPEGKLVEDETSKTMAFFVIPGKQGIPRWLIPANPRHGLRVLQQWQPCDLKSRLKWQILLLVYRFGQLKQLPGIERIFVSMGDASKSEPVPMVPVVYVGTPSNAMKLVVMDVEAGSGKPVQVRKIPMEPDAKSRILNESSVLARLAVESFALGPAVLSINKDEGSATQQFVESAPSSGRFSKRHIDWLLKMRREAKTIAFSEAIANLRARLMALGTERMDVQEQLKRLQALSEEFSLPAVIVHGDFSPWNIRILRNGNLFMVDWEEAELCGLPLLDIFHFHLIRPYATGEPLPSLDVLLRNRHVKRYVKTLGITRYSAEKLFGYYLLDIWCRQRALLEQTPMPALTDRIQQHWRDIA